MSDIVAYSSDSISLLKAQWDTTYGMWAEFALKQPESMAKQAHPFKQHTKRRKGKVGTRFKAVFVNADESNAYNDDIMLKGWTDGTGGWKVSFFINADESGFHPFMHYDKGHIMAVVMVELDDDEEAIDQTKRDRVEGTSVRRKTPRLSVYAAQLCRTPEFHRYLMDRCGDAPSGGLHAAEWAAEWMRKRLKIESRADLDTCREAAHRFHQHIRDPYQKWYRRTYG